MPDWIPDFRPELPWAPSGLSGTLKTVPGWLARGASESRFAAEVLHFQVSLVRGVKASSHGLPSGDGRPVLLVPGFGFGDPATLPLQMAVNAGGYKVVRSKIWANVRCGDRAVEGLGAVAKAAVERDNGRRLLVVGHSRGGMLARGLAARFPELIERVISLGAPLNYEFAFYELPKPMVEVLTVVHQMDPHLRRMKCGTPDCSCPYMTATRHPLPSAVDLVSIYSKSDGVVDWRACVVPGATNLEVPGTHLGMGLRPSTTRVVMEALAMPIGPVNSTG